MKGLWKFYVFSLSEKDFEVFILFLSGICLKNTLNNTFFWFSGLESLSEKTFVWTFLIFLCLESLFENTWTFCIFSVWNPSLKRLWTFLIFLCLESLFEKTLNIFTFPCLKRLWTFKIFLCLKSSSEKTLTFFWKNLSGNSVWGARVGRWSKWQSFSRPPPQKVG